MIVGFENIRSGLFVPALKLGHKTQKRCLALSKGDNKIAQRLMNGT